MEGIENDPDYQIVCPDGGMLACGALATNRRFKNQALFKR
jgi:hypothetical protein